MNRDIATLRAVVVKVTQLLAGQTIEVTQQGMQAYVQADPRTGKIVRVNIPHIPDNASSELVMAVQGFIDHEVGHILDTDPAIMIEANKAGERTRGMWNVVEDTFIERKMAKRFPGTGYNLDRLHEFFLREVTVPAIEKAETVRQRFSYLLVPAARAWAGQRRFQEFMKDYWDHPDYKPLFDKLGDLPKKFEAINSSKEALEMARQMMKAFDEPEMSMSGEGDGDESSGKKGKDKSKSKSSKESDGEGSGDEEDSSEGSGKGGKPSKSKKDKTDAKDKDGDAGADAEAEKDEKKEDDASDDGDGKGDDSDEAPSEDKPSGGEGSDVEKAEEDEDKGKGASESEDDADNDGEEDGSDAGAGDGSDEDGSGDVPDKLKDQLESDVKSKSFEPISCADFDNSLSEVLSEKAVETAGTSSYLVFTKDFDRIGVFDPTLRNEEFGGYRRAPAWNDQWLIDLDEKTRHMVGQMQKDIERMMAARSKTINLPGQRRGRLNASGLYRIALEDDRVFRQREVSRSKEVAVGLLIDNSGSMGGMKMEVAMTSGYALSQTLERVGIKHEVLGFTTLDSTASNMKVIQAEERRIGRSFSRYEPLNMPIFKTFSERLTPEVRRRFAYAMKTPYLANNVDGECVEIAAQRLVERMEKRKVLLVLSDGQPAAHTSDRYALPNHLKKVVQEATKKGVECIGIGIMSEAVRSYYPKNMTLKSAEELPGVVMGELKKILTAV